MWHFELFKIELKVIIVILNYEKYGLNIICTLLFIYMSKMSIWDHEIWIANFNCIHCQNFSLKTKFILSFIYLFILITLGRFTQYPYYTCFKLYKKCYKNLCAHTKHQKTFSSSFSRLLPNTGKWNSFPKNVI